MRKRLSEAQKTIILSAEKPVSVLSKELGFSTRTISQFAKTHNITLPKARRLSLIYNVVVGNEYGFLTVESPVVIDNRTKYKCTCRCGTVVIRDRRSLFHTRIPNCGCFPLEVHYQRRKQPGMASAHVLFLNYRRNAVVRNRKFTLTEKQFIKLCQSNCFYCGTKPARQTKRGNSATPFTYNGVDRKNNKQGYTKSNSVPCCTTCNYAKGDKTLEQFLKWINRIHKHAKHWK